MVLKPQYVRFDWVIKRMLRDKANFVIVEGFLSELLRQDVQIQEILESESNKDSLDQKLNRVDMLVRDGQGRLVLIEFQYETELDYFHRILFGTSRLISEYIKAGEPYSEVKKVISVSLVYFELGQGDDYVYQGTTSFKGIHDHDTLQLSEKQQKLYQCETVADIYPEYYLIRIAKFQDIVSDKLDEWVYFLKNETIRDDFTAKGLQQARDRLEVVKLSGEERVAYQQYTEDLRYQASMEQSKHWEGYMEGEKRARLEIARKLLQTMDALAVSELTGLDLATVQSLQ
jgi:predicted transposase/invertase (TIGR01784 family)